MVVVASDTFNQRNQGATTAESIAAWLEMARAATARGRARCRSRSPPPSAARSRARSRRDESSRSRETLAEGEPVEIAIADTIGVGVPSQVTDLVGRLREALPGMRLRCHFHNTRNTGIANAYAAVEAGVDALDASIGGIGGCPFAPAATGNIPTEDLLLHAARAWASRPASTSSARSRPARWLEERFGAQGSGTA